jgi:RNA polymerase sigma factor (sigma-70 family)
MSSDPNKTNKKTLELIALAQKGSSRAENDVIKMYTPYVEFMVKKYSKKTEIKDDDDLRSCIFLGMLDSIRKFDPNRNVSFMYFAYIWMKKRIFLEEPTYRFIRIPVNQKIFYDTYIKNKKEKEEWEIDMTEAELQRFMTVDNTSTTYFTELSTYDSISGLYELPEKLLYHRNNNAFNNIEDSLSINVLKTNINKVLKKFNKKEKYIIEHLFGLNKVERLCSEQIAKNLNVTKVNITFTKNRVIKMMRHASLSNKLLDSI